MGLGAVTTLPGPQSGKTCVSTWDDRSHLGNPSPPQLKKTLPPVAPTFAEVTVTMAGGKPISAEVGATGIMLC